MRKRKTLKELTVKDNFMFAAVMMDEEIAREVLELTLNIPIDHVSVSYEKSIIYNPEYKGIRLDVYVKDDAGSRFDVEMQVAAEKIHKRARYYHSEIDRDLLISGLPYEKLPDTYVIFICDFDPIGLGKYKYTKYSAFVEDKTYEYCDGSHTVFLSSVGTNDNEVSKELINFLKYVGSDLESSQNDFNDEFVAKLQRMVTKIKNDREMGGRYMKFEELLKDEYNAGVEDGKRQGELTGIEKGIEKDRKDIIFSMLELRGNVSDSIRNQVDSLSDPEILKELVFLAASCKSLDEFEEALKSKVK